MSEEVAAKEKTEIEYLVQILKRLDELEVEVVELSQAVAQGKREEHVHHHYHQRSGPKHVPPPDWQGEWL